MYCCQKYWVEPEDDSLSQSRWLIKWAASFVIGSLLIVTDVQAALTINSVTYTYGTQSNVATVYVQPSASITVTVNETTTGGTSWGSTLWRINTTPPGATTCNTAPTPTQTGNGLHSTTLSVTAPATEGAYNGYFRASSQASACGGTLSALFTSTSSVIVDSTAPTIPTATIASNNATPSLAKTGDIVTLAFTTDDANGVQTPVVSIAGSSAIVSGGPSSWTATHTMAAGDVEGVVAFTINVNDTAGNAATQRTSITSGSNVTFDKTAPTVSSINRVGATPTNAASVQWTVIFSESVTGVDSSDFALANGGLGGTPTISSVTGSGTTWTVTADTGSGSGSLGLNLVDDDTIIDIVDNPLAGVGAGNGNFSGQVYSIDRTVPTVSSITLVNPTPTALASVSWTVTFSESVTGVDAADFALDQAGGVSGAGITLVTGGGTSWTVTASTGIGNGTLGLNLVDDDSIVDDVSNPLGGTGASNGNFSGDVYSVVRPASPTSCIDDNGIGTKAWATLTGPLTSDNAYASAVVTDGETTHYLKCTGYGFAIPANAIIEGITVGVERWADNTNLQDAAMRIVKGNAIGATDRSNVGTYPSADPNTYDNHGGVTDLWGTTWTPADINAENFGTALASRKSNTTGGNRTIRVDHLAISVAYRLPVNCTSQSSGNWSVPGTWTNCRSGVPLDGDSATIANTHNVTLNVNTPTLATITVNFGGILTNTGGNSISLSGAMNNAGTYFGGSGAIVVAGSFTNTGSYSSGSATTTLSGNFSNSGTFTADTSTWVFSGGSAQSISGGTSFNNLTLNNAAGLTLNNDVTASGALTLTSGAFSVGANTLTLNGSAIAGTATNLATTASSSLSFGGSSVGVTVPGSVTALNNLTINNSSGVSLGGSSVTTTLSGALTLGANNLTTGTNTLALAGDCTANGGNGSLTRTSGHVIGNLKLTFPTGSSACTYHVGDSIGYSPVTMAIAVTGAGTLSVRVDAADHPDTVSAASGIDETKSANHYWTVTAGTLTHTGYSATFRFCANSGSCTATEVDSAANTGNFIVALKTAGIWSTQTAGARNSYSTQATGISGFGEFAVGELSTNNCYNDSFTGADGASPGTNWSVGYKTGTFGNPVIFGNRLRLNNASSTAATWATLQKLFPAAGNKITVEFDHFAYGGTGSGDGIAVVLSNASVAPQAGAFGGSLGYAQKGQTPISDCTTIGGCPGFTGGWLGIALDEYGNYSTNTEGRFGGYATRILNSVAVRGSGSGMSGYRYLLGTSTLSPAIDGNGSASPPHRYRIIVDHTDSIHAWASVERDITGGGTAYTILIGCPPGVTSGCTAFDVKDPGNSQDAVPAYWNLSFTGSTGASTNIHEVDSLKVCTVQGLASPVLHHIKIEHGGTACTSNAATVIVKACANAACDALYMGTVTANLSTTDGTWSPTSPITFSGGQATVTLTDTTAGSDTLGATATSPTASNATQCFNGATETCILTFATCTFDVIEVGAAVNTPIYTKLANIAFNLDVLSRSGASQSLTAIELVDMSSGTCDSPAGVLSPVTISPVLTGGVPNFSANQRKTFSFTYANAAPNVRVRITTAGPLYSCSSDNFAIRPQSFNLTSSATQTGSSGLPVFRAGMDPFSLSATAVYSATTTTNYAGTPKLNLNSGMITTTLAHLGALGSTTFSPASSGVATASGLTYSEAGSFSLAQYAVYDDTFAQVDSVKGECVSDFSNTLTNSRYSCQFGSAAAGAFGRFVPDHFTATGAVVHACSAGLHTYMGQTFTLSTSNVAEAKNAANGTTQNYAGAYAPGTVSFGAENADNGTDLSSRLTFLSGSWTSGIYTLASANATFTRPTVTAPDASWGSFESLDIGLTVNDSDVATSPKVSGADMNPGAAGGSSFAYKKFSGTPMRMLLGRLNLQNAYGSELLDLPMPLTAEYWDGISWVTNTADNCTALTAPSGSRLALNLANGGTTTATLNSPLVSGDAGLSLSAPGATHAGYVDVTIDSPAWLDFNWQGAGDTDPSARATFGIYNSDNKFIYIRELY